MEQQKKYSYSKTEKLKSRKIISELFTSGLSFKKYPLRAVCVETDLPIEDVNAQVAVSVSKRNFKLAVDRNRIKRLMREAYRLEKHNLLSNLDKKIAVMIIYSSREELEFAELQIKMQKLLKKINANYSKQSK
jgi:ribonuclease P protein component